MRLFDAICGVVIPPVLQEDVATSVLGVWQGLAWLCRGGRQRSPAGRAGQRVSGRQNAGLAKSALHGEMALLHEVSNQQVLQNTQMNDVVASMTQGIQDVTGGSAAIEQAMSQLNTRITSGSV